MLFGNAFLIILLKAQQLSKKLYSEEEEESSMKKTIYYTRMGSSLSPVQFILCTFIFLF